MIFNNSQLQLLKSKFSKYSSLFSVNNFRKKISAYANQAGVKTVYTALLLFYAFRREETPLWAKNIIIGVLGYFISPIDAIPDLSPVLGYTDDFAILAFGLVTIAGFVNESVREKAQLRLKKWFANINPAHIQEIDDKL